MNACPDLLAALKLRQRDLEMNLAAMRARLAEVQEMLDLIERPQRKRGRPPGPRAVPLPNPPLHVAGANHQPPDDDELPFQSDVPGT